MILKKGEQKQRFYAAIFIKLCAKAGLEFIKKLRPVTYHYDMSKMASILQMPENVRLKDAEAEKEKILYSGFIAQEVEKAAQDVGYDFSGVDKPQNDKSIYGLRYSEFVVPLVKAVQEQQSMIEKQQQQIDQLKALVASGSVNENVKSVDRLVVNLSDKDILVLNQNVPNPFAEQTVINYNIPSTANVAQLSFYDGLGRQIKVIDITNKGAGSLNVFANDLTNGIYSYTLIVDGQIVDTKKMVKQQ